MIGVALLIGNANAQPSDVAPEPAAAPVPEPDPAPEPEPAFEPRPAPLLARAAPPVDPAASLETAFAPRDLLTPLGLASRLHIHGFVSQGAFVSTANDYIGHSSRGSVELFQAGLNVSTEITDKLRAGVQLFSHDEGLYGDYTPRLDWAYLDYRWRPWLGLRAGHIKIPFGLYGEYADIDVARTSILLPQSVYPIGNRDVLLAQTGFETYGTIPMGRGGELDYRLYAGSLFAPVGGAVSRAAGQTYAVDTKYLIGGQVFWHPPVEGLRVGGSVLRGSIDFHADLDPATTNALIAGMLVPPTFNGQITTSFRPVTLKVASAEYVHGDWQLSAEYARWFARTVFSLLLPTSEVHSERLYAMATYHLNDWFELGAYYSMFHPNVDDRAGRALKPKPRFFGFQRDAAVTLRFDATERWTWKAEGHFIDGVAAMFDGAILDPTLNMMPHRYWGLFLANTTVTF